MAFILIIAICITSPISLRKKIGQLIMESFIGSEVTFNSDIAQDIITHKVGGAIIFSSKMHANIQGPAQLQSLTSTIKQISSNYTGYPFLFSVDEEGWQVARLRKSNGFVKIGNYAHTLECGRIIGKMLSDMRLDIYIDLYDEPRAWTE